VWLICGWTSVVRHEAEIYTLSIDRTTDIFRSTR